MGFNALAGMQGFNAGVKSVQDLNDQWDAEDLKNAQKQVGAAQVQQNPDGTYTFLGQQFDQAPTQAALDQARTTGLAAVANRFGRPEDAMRLRAQAGQLRMQDLQLQGAQRQADMDAKEDAALKMFEPINQQLMKGDFSGVAQALPGIYNSDHGPVADGHKITLAPAAPGSGYAAQMQRLAPDAKTGQLKPVGDPQNLTASDLHRYWREVQLATLSSLNPSKYGQAYDQLLHNKESNLIQRDQLKIQKQQADNAAAYQQGQLGIMRDQLGLAQRKYNDDVQEDTARQSALRDAVGYATGLADPNGTPESREIYKRYLDESLGSAVGHGQDPNRLLGVLPGLSAILPQRGGGAAASGKLPQTLTDAQKLTLEQAHKLQLADPVKYGRMTDAIIAAGGNPAEFGMRDPTAEIQRGIAAMVEAKNGAAQAAKTAPKDALAAEYAGLEAARQQARRTGDMQTFKRADARMQAIEQQLGAASEEPLSPPANIRGTPQELEWLRNRGVQ